MGDLAVCRIRTVRKTIARVHGARPFSIRLNAYAATASIVHFMRLPCTARAVILFAPVAVTAQSAAPPRALLPIDFVNSAGSHSTSTTAIGAVLTYLVLHGIDHQDWFATLGDKRITMSGGWHDAGDLSQGLINTGEGNDSRWTRISAPRTVCALRRGGVHAVTGMVVAHVERHHAQRRLRASGPG